MNVLAEQITEWCNQLCPMPREKKIAVKYGLELLLENLVKLLGIFLIAGIFGLADRVAIFCLVFCPFRMLAGGIHMRTGTGCFIFMLVLIGMSLVSEKYFLYSQEVCLVISGLSVVMCLVYAPRDTKKNPIIYESVRKIKKCLAVLYCALCSFIVQWVAIDEIKVLVVTTLFLETVTILPVVDYINESRFQKRREMI